MRIITINIPESYIKAMDKLVGNQGLYPSRSELIRVAVREFLISKLRVAVKFQKLAENKRIPNQCDNVEYIRIPVVNDDIGTIRVDPDEKIYKTFKILKPAAEANVPARIERLPKLKNQETLDGFKCKHLDKGRCNYPGKDGLVCTRKKCTAPYKGLPNTPAEVVNHAN